MRSQLTASKGGLTVTVDEPVSGDRTLRGRCTFARGDAEDFATIELGLISRKHRHLFGTQRWMPELKIKVCRKQVTPGAGGAADFELPYPALLAPFKGGMIEVAVQFVATASDGTTIRLLLERAPQPVDAHRVLRGLPIESYVRRPGLLSSLPLLRWFAPRDVRVLIEEKPGAKDAQLRVTVEGNRGVKGVRAGLVAAEFEIERGQGVYKHDPLIEVEKPLISIGNNLYQADLTVPAAGEAPPSMILKWANTQHGIVWEVRVELENEKGRRAQSAIPIHVGTVYGITEKTVSDSILC